MDGIKGKELHFCEEYILDYNGTAAARRAGYPDKSAAKKASQLLHREDIRERVQQLQKERSQRLCVAQDFVLQQALEVLQKCQAAVPVTEWDYTTHQLVETGEYQFDSKGACKALELIGKMVGIGEGNGQEYQTPVFLEDIPKPGGGDDG